MCDFVEGVGRVTAAGLNRRQEGLTTECVIVIEAAAATAAPASTRGHVSFVIVEAVAN
jgi:hypothetical protein